MNVSELEEYLSRNPHSPLFARLAAEYFATGRTGEAAALCRKGLAVFPRYATAHLILARCYAKESNFALALSSLEDVRKTFPVFPLFEQLFHEWNQSIGSPAAIAVPSIPARNTMPLLAPVQIPAAASQTEPVQTPPAQPAGDTPTAAPVETQAAEEVISDEERAQIESRKREADDRNRIVSKTLAEIYADQEEFEEAIVTYALLMKQKPEFKEQYEKRIAELKISLQTKLQQDQK